MACVVTKLDVISLMLDVGLSVWPCRLLVAEARSLVGPSGAMAMIAGLLTTNPEDEEDAGWGGEPDLLQMVSEAAEDHESHGAAPQTGCGRGAAASAKGRAKGKAKGKAKADTGKKPPKSPATGKRHSPKTQQAAPAEKKCQKCKKTLPIEDFHADQGRCKCCSKRVRGFTGLVSREGLNKEYEQMESDEPKEADRLYMAYCKHSNEQEKLVTKRKFSLHEYFREYRSRRGFRLAGVGEMMWEGEYYEWAKTAKAGFLSDTEAKANWDKWLNDKSVAKDMGGPRGYRRCRVRVRDICEEFEEAALEEGVRSSGKLAKNISEEHLQRQIELTMSRSQGQDPGQWESIAQRARAVAGAGDEHDEDGLLGGALTEPTMGELRMRSATKRKGKSAEQDLESESESAAEEDDEEGDDDDDDTDQASHVHKSVLYDLSFGSNLILDEALQTYPMHSSPHPFPVLSSQALKNCKLSLPFLSPPMGGSGGSCSSLSGV